MENRTCKTCQTQFVIEADDFAFYEKINVPPPTLCPHCRMIRRFLYRNERAWYRRTCAATGKPVLSMYAPDLPLTIYEENYWKSDAWDPLDYGRNIDFSRPFFEQFFALFRTVPHPNLIQKNNVASDYSNHTLNLKNCYFCISTDTAEDSAYLFTAMLRMRNSFDGHQSSDSEYCYEIIDSKKCNRVAFVQNCEACVESAFLYDCRNATNCFGCVGLRNAQYVIFNEQYSKEEYQKKLTEYWNGSYSTFQEVLKKFNELKLTYPHKYAYITNSYNVSGDDIYNARNCQHCFFAREAIENCKYGYRIWENTKDGWDGVVVWKGSEVFYDVLSVTGQRIFFSAYVWGGNDVEYSYNCFDCSNVFGCIGLRSKSYCIFNKQYSKEEYLELVEKLKQTMRQNGEYGEFFPIEYSPFCYNETIAQDYFPITKEEASIKKLPWRNPEEKHYNITLKTEAIPDKIGEITDSILKEVISCAHQGTCTEQCSTAFKITPEELQFYQVMKLPLPRLCPNCRHFNRVKLKTPLKLWHRSCMCSKTNHEHAGICQNEFETAYNPERPEVVYCESCYNKEIL